MTAAQVEARLSALEHEVASLRAKINATPANPNNWVEEIAGTFAKDPLFEEAIHLGRKWRKAEPVKSRRTSRPATPSKRHGRK